MSNSKLSYYIQRFLHIFWVNYIFNIAMGLIRYARVDSHILLYFISFDFVFGILSVSALLFVLDYLFHY